jgi:hypothetical protein
MCKLMLGLMYEPSMYCIIFLICECLRMCCAYYFDTWEIQTSRYEY